MDEALHLLNHPLFPRGGLDRFSFSGNSNCGPISVRDLDHIAAGGELIDVFLSVSLPLNFSNRIGPSPARISKSF